MNYWNKIDADDFAYLMQHEEGLKSWQTDYRLLQKLRAESYLAELEDYKRDIAEYNVLKEKSKEQTPLYPENYK